MKAINQDAKGTMQALSQKPASASPVNVYISGDVAALKDVIGIEIEQNNRRQKVALSTGLQRVNF